MPPNATMTKPLPRHVGRSPRLAALALAALLSLPAHGHRDHPAAPASPSARAVAAGDTSATAGVSGAAATPIATYTGRVETLTVIDRTSGVAYRYPRLLLADGARVQLEGVALPADGAYVSVTGRLAQRTLVAELVQTATDPAPLARATASRGQLEGTLRVFHVDYPDGTAEYGYALRTDAGRGNVVSFGRPPASIDNGMRAVISGPMNERGFISVDTIEITAPPAATKPGAQADGTPAAATTAYTVMPLKYPNNTSAPWAYNADPASWGISAINSSVLGSDTGSVADYYEEVSFGAQLVSGVVANAGNAWLLATVARPTACSSDAQLDAVLASIESQGQAAANAAGFNVNSRPGQLYVVDSLPCGWAGLGYIGFPLAYTKGTASLLVVGHEIGHNFGLYHAGSIDCGASVVASTGCAVTEYGDPFDVMGNQRAMHLNARQKAILGYIGSGGVATHASGTTTYTLNPIELAGQARYAVRVPTGSSNRTYWIEFRQPIGFDSALSNFPNLGAQIRLSYPFENQCSGCTGMYDDTQFLDMTPGTAAFTDGALLAGQSYTDTQHNITINVLAASAASIDVQVSVGGGGGGPVSTTTTLGSSANPSPQGQSVTFTATVTGSAPTGTIVFKDGGSTITGCSSVALAGSGNARSAACSTSALGAGAHGITAEYSGDAGNTASTSAQLMQTVTAVMASTTTSVTSAPGTTTQGQPVTFTATVTGVAPTGTVSFRDGGVAIVTCGSVALTGSGNTRTATCATSSLIAGNHAISVQYSGDSANASSLSTTLTQVVNPTATPIATTVKLGSSSNPAPATGSVTFTATIDQDVPGGTVRFFSNGGIIPGCANVTVSTGGALRTAQCVTPLSSGAFTIVANYSGSGLYQPSSSLPFAQVKSFAGIGNTVQFAAASYGVNENTPSVTVTVTRIGDVTTAAVVNYATAPGTATSAEFQATSGTLTWAAQDSTPRAITIPILDEVGAEPDESFTISLSAPSGTTLGPIPTATITVIDNESAPVVMPVSATIVQNPYGTPNVLGATRVGNDISAFTRSVDIELGTIAGAAGSFARIDFQGLSIGPGNTLRIRSGAVGQAVQLVNVSGANADIGGQIVAIGGNGAPPPVLVVQSAAGVALSSSGRVASPSGLTVSAVYADITTGNPLLNQGTIEGGPSLALKAARVNGGGLFRGNAISFATFGNLNNPANGAHYVANGLQLHPGSGNAIAVSIAGYGAAPQVYNLMLNGNGTLSMPSVWPAGSPLPPTNRPVLPNEIRAAGVPDPAFGGGQIIVQASGSLTLEGGASQDFVFPGGFVLKSNGPLDIKGTLLANGWTTSGTTYQGIFLEAPSIVDSTGAAAMAVFTNDLNWANFAVRPGLPVQTSTLRRQGNGTAQYGSANTLAPHLNFYALVTEAGAAGLCYICLVNTTVMDLTIAP